jgi:4-hydroxy-4-methyl-2-oxoglutarate aldolase
VLPGSERLPQTTIDRLRATSGLTAAVSDVLDDLGWHLVIPATILAPRLAHSPVAVGYAVTTEYLPARGGRRPEQAVPTEVNGDPPPPAFDPGYRLAAPGDVLVLGAHGLDGVSVFGGRVAAAASNSGVGGVVVDGAVRDLDEIREAGLQVWSRGVTPITGKVRLEQASTNRPLFVAGVQVHPGDLVIADTSGVCFVPPSIAAVVAERVLKIAAAEARGREKAGTDDAQAKSADFH